MAGKERFHGGHFPKNIVLQAVFWYLRYSLSYRDIEELMKERGVELDHATAQQWVIKYTPTLETEFRKRKKAVGTSWRMAETYIKVKGVLNYFLKTLRQNPIAPTNKFRRISGHTRIKNHGSKFYPNSAATRNGAQISPEPQSAGM